MYTNKQTRAVLTLTVSTCGRPGGVVPVPQLMHSIGAAIHNPQAALHAPADSVLLQRRDLKGIYARKWRLVARYV